MKHIIHSLLFFCILFVGCKTNAQNTNQKAADEKLLTEYFALQKLTPTRTSSGLYYIIARQGTGANAKKGQTVEMKYRGMFLNGQQFDANVDANFNLTRAFSFTLGVGQVIEGWDEAIQLFNPGTRATIYLPSALGYGPGGAGSIPPNSVLLFDVEVISAR